MLNMNFNYETAENEIIFKTRIETDTVYIELYYNTTRKYKHIITNNDMMTSTQVFSLQITMRQILRRPSVS